MIGRLTALLCLLALAAPAGALAQGGAFDPLPPAQPDPQTTVPPQDVNNQDEDDGLSNRQQVLIGLSGFVLLLGIGWAIVRDARSAAPVEDRRAAGDDPRPKGSQKPAGVRHRENRAKAKAARQARKKQAKRR